MLNNDFFTITALNIEEDAIKATLQLNEKHKIFDGHFPGQPVVPGVCMVQMVKEVAETALEKELLLTKADDIKFLMVINPNENKIIQLLLNYSTEETGEISFYATLFIDSSIYFKFKGLFTPRH